MSDCPVKTYFSYFLDSCVKCPSSIQSCEGLGLSDSQSCKQSCTASPNISQENSVSFSTGVVIGMVAGIMAFLVLVVVLGLYFKYRQRSEQTENEDTGDNRGVVGHGQNDQMIELIVLDAAPGNIAFQDNAELPGEITVHHGVNINETQSRIDTGIPKSVDKQYRAAEL
ncbi:uncharacterized protein LOC114524565 [Dendronephthya gigantea]|uniref:uncharacterized protein LOC114524565 n=1 Tax=Dendronephthya gigantea TaxID=151771 RepID=UPI00106A1DC0|nr:uncharacterized protein LOC114524565 [Dendronephthya gigantea]